MGRYKMLGEDWGESHEFGPQVPVNGNYVICLKANKRKEERPRENEKSEQYSRTVRRKDSRIRQPGFKPRVPYSLCKFGQVNGLSKPLFLSAKGGW